MDLSSFMMSSSSIVIEEVYSSDMRDFYYEKARSLWSILLPTTLFKNVLARSYLRVPFLRVPV